MTPDYTFQANAIWQTAFALDDVDSVILQAATGAGKTHMAITLSSEVPKPVLFLAESREIIGQTREAFKSRGIDTDLLTADTKTSREGMLLQSDVTIASQRTVWSRGVRAGHDIGDFKTIITDEGHHARARTYEEIYKLFPDAKHILLTATPIRGDGMGMGNIAQVMVQGDDYNGNYTDLIERGVLVPCPAEKVWTWPVDLRGVRTQAGDYAMGGSRGAARIMDKAKLIGDIVMHWKKLADNRRTIAFATSVAHAENIAGAFQAEGVSAAYVSAKTPKDERDRILSELAAGTIRVVANYGILTEGFDCPAVSCIILARPTKLFGLYLQMVGRGLRASPGKEDLMVLDHAGIVPKHGLPGSDITWTLETNNKAAIQKQDTPKVCPKCNGMMMKGECVSCGYTKPTASNGGEGWMDEYQGDDHDVQTNLARLSDGGDVEGVVTNADQMRRDYFRLIHKAEAIGVKPGWASHKFKEKYGQFPPTWVHLPDPAKCTPRKYFEGCSKFAKKKGWADGWADMQFKEVYGRYPEGAKE